MYSRIMLFSIASWNVKGLNSPLKRQKVWKYLLDHGFEVVALQETHLKREEELRLRHKKYALIYRSSAITKHRGVALMFPNSLKFQPEDIKSDKEGRVVLVKGKVRGRLCTFISGYAPNTGQSFFLQPC